MPTPGTKLKFGVTLDDEFEVQLRRDPQFRDALEDIAERAADFARAFAPFRTGDYMESIHVEPRFDEESDVRLMADDWKSHWIEYGTAPHGDHPGTPAFAPLTNGVRAAGMELREGKPKKKLGRRTTAASRRTGRTDRLIFEEQGRGSKLKDPKTKRYV